MTKLKKVGVVGLVTIVIILLGVANFAQGRKEGCKTVMRKLLKSAQVPVDEKSLDTFCEAESQ